MSQQLLEKESKNNGSAISELFKSTVLMDSARKYESLGNYQAAADELKNAVEIVSRAVGDTTDDFAQVLAELGHVLSQQVNLPEAESTLKRALEILEKVYYADHYKLSPVWDSLGYVYVQQGRVADAEVAYRRAMEINQKTQRGDHPHLLESMHKLSWVLRKQDKFADAETILKKMVQSCDSPWGPVEDYLYDLAVVYQALDKNTEAESTYKQAIDALTQRTRYLELARCLDSFAEFLKQQNKMTESDKASKAALDYRQKYN